MTREQLSLNSFDDFDRFLFPDNNKNWRKFWGGNERQYYIPPIQDPIKLVEFQLNHYALWMSISEIEELDYSAEIDLLQKGYGCKYVEHIHNKTSRSPSDFTKCFYCPIKERYLGEFRICHYAQKLWFETKDSKYAWIYANCKWLERFGEDYCKYFSTKKEIPENIALNDFDGFDCILFENSVPNWKKYYKSNPDRFYPPIKRPSTMVEYQLNHYALWMTIAHNHLKKKPSIVFSKYITNDSYACESAYINGTGTCRFCPISVNKNCPSDYFLWIHHTRSNVDPNIIFELAIKIAKMTWKEGSDRGN